MTEPFGDRRARALAAVHDQGVEAFLASDIGTIRWLTGRVQDIESGPAPWSAGIHLLLTADGSALILPDEEAGDTGDDRAYPYEAFTTAVDLVPHRHAAGALAQAVSDMGIGRNAPVAVESAAVPGALVLALNGRPLVDAGPLLRTARAVKDEAELRVIRAAADLVNRGHRTLRERMRPDMSEIELWSMVHAAIENEAGERVPALVDLLSGGRCAEVGGPPTRRVLARDDLVLFDLVPRRNGYWADSCVTYSMGVPSREVQRLHDTARSALEAGVRCARPGVTAGTLDACVRRIMQDAGFEYPHHTGHGVGLSTHEAPRIVPGSEQMLEANMVVALEPGSYGDGFGLRLEHLMIVRPDGGEIITDYSLDLR